MLTWGSFNSADPSQLWSWPEPRTGPECPAKLCTNSPVATRQTRAVSSAQTVTAWAAKAGPWFLNVPHRSHSGTGRHVTYLMTYVARIFIWTDWCWTVLCTRRSITMPPCMSFWAMYDHQTSNALGLPNERAIRGESAREDLSLMRQLLVCMETAGTKGRRHHHQPLILHPFTSWYKYLVTTWQVRSMFLRSCKHLKVAVLQMRTFQSQPGLGKFSSQLKHWGLQILWSTQDDCNKCNRASFAEAGTGLHKLFYKGFMELSQHTSLMNHRKRAGCHDVTSVRWKRLEEATSFAVLITW